jgi:ABC-2 type transport system ATP-binding protein
MTAVIHVNHVTKRFGRHKAVDNVSFEVPPGCVFALLGENGAGKTTLVRMMMGLLAPDAGGISVFGLDSAKRGEQIRRRVGYVPERPTLYEWMTAAEIGWFTAGFYGGRFEQHFRNLIDKYGVPFERKINQMSKGMRAKVSLSLAMAHQPELLVLDEPTSGLDTLVRREFLESMVDLAAEGRTVLLSSHLIGEVERVADYVAIVRDGQLLVIEQLDHLKRTTRELTVTMQAGAASPPTQFPGQVLRCERRGRQWQVLLRGVEDDAELDRITESADVVASESRTPSLEEVFVAYMRDDVPTSPAQPPETSSEVVS